ncbi:hypothetical protein [Streptomyces sp. NPDC006274]|uniref:hypothetical protein n=1 Tax=unclassified Streptomyces TaxID=2593676 RepID=UPI0033BE5C49
MALPMRRGGGGAPERRRPAWTDPFGEFENKWSETGKLLERAAAPTAAGEGGWMPTAEEAEEEGVYVVRTELPDVGETDEA